MSSSSSLIPRAVGPYTFQCMCAICKHFGFEITYSLPSLPPENLCNTRCTLCLNMIKEDCARFYNGEYSCGLNCAHLKVLYAYVAAEQSKMEHIKELQEKEKSVFASPDVCVDDTIPANKTGKKPCLYKPASSEVTVPQSKEGKVFSGTPAFKNTSFEVFFTENIVACLRFRRSPSKWYDMTLAYNPPHWPETKEYIARLFGNGFCALLEYFSPHTVRVTLTCAEKDQIFCYQHPKLKDAITGEKFSSFAKENDESKPADKVVEKPENKVPDKPKNEVPEKSFVLDKLCAPPAFSCEHNRENRNETFKLVWPSVESAYRAHVAPDFTISKVTFATNYNSGQNFTLHFATRSESEPAIGTYNHRVCLSPVPITLQFGSEIYYDCILQTYSKFGGLPFAVMIICRSNIGHMFSYVFNFSSKVTSSTQFSDTYPGEHVPGFYVSNDPKVLDFEKSPPVPKLPIIYPKEPTPDPKEPTPDPKEPTPDPKEPTPDPQVLVRVTSYNMYIRGVPFTFDVIDGKIKRVLFGCAGRCFAMDLLPGSVTENDFKCIGHYRLDDDSVLVLHEPEKHDGYMYVNGKVFYHPELKNTFEIVRSKFVSEPKKDEPTPEKTVEPVPKKNNAILGKKSRYGTGVYFFQKTRLDFGDVVFKVELDTQKIHSIRAIVNGETRIWQEVDTPRVNLSGKIKTRFFGFSGSPVRYQFYLYDCGTLVVYSYLEDITVRKYYYRV